MEMSPQNMIDTTDALEAVSACQAMKNFLFALILIGLALCQTIFWMNHFGMISDDNGRPAQKDEGACSSGCTKTDFQKTGLIFLAATAESMPKPMILAENIAPAPVSTASEPAAEEVTPVQAQEQPASDKSIEQAVEEAIGSSSQLPVVPEILLGNETAVEETAPSELLPEDTQSAEGLEPFENLSLFRISSKLAKGVVAVCNFVIIVASILYSLSLLMCLKISLAGRLGGINHITRAFFISLFMLVVLIPWQALLPNVLVGAVWAPGALWSQCWAKADSSLFWRVMLYLRFCGLPFAALWLLMWTQIRSGKWTRATLRRLGVVR